MPWLSIFLLLPFVNAANPLIDFDRMGRVGLAGAFAGFDFSNQAPVSFDPATSTLFVRQQDGALAPIGATNSQGRINAGCAIGDTFYFGGSFSSVAGVSANNVATYSSSSRTISPLGSDGPNGEVDAFYCDEKEHKVWVGGKFTTPGSAVAVWDTKASSWSKPPFNGVRGAGAQVTSITANSSQSSLFFAGSFLAPFGSAAVINGTNNPNVPFSAGASPYSSSLVPVPLSNVEVDGAPSTTEQGFSDIKAILCPAGNDGPGNTWFARDGDTAVVTIRTFTMLGAAGVRLGNTFLGNHATTGFSVTTIPDNTVRTLHYVDPTTGQNQTCSDPCPLLTDSNILYQDFLFDSTVSITGVQIKLTQWNGQAPGLHIVQLLSSGAFASAIDGRNGPSCFAPQSSTAAHTGNWIAKVANTEIAGTTQEVLVSSVNVGTSSSNGPSFTWMPYVSASGNYEVNLLVPGCNSFQDCALRTSVKVTVFPGNGLPPSITEVSQRNENAVVKRIYSGPIVPTTPDFVATITMTLSDSPEGQGQNGKYEIVADRVQLVLQSSNITEGESSGTPFGGPGSQVSFGFLEWPRSSKETVDATSSLPNTTLTDADHAGIQLFRDLGGSTSANTSINAVAHHSSGAIILGGSFALAAGSASGTSNIVIFRNGDLAALPDSGLNGAVSSLVLVGDKLFVGGSFRDTLSGSQQGRLRGVAVYDVAANSWSSLQNGVDGAVSSLNYVDGKVQVAGNFTQTLTSENSGTPARGLAAWKVDTGAWVGTGGLVVGNINMVANGTNSEQYVAGSVSASRKFGATGLVLLKNGDDDDDPTVEPLVPQLGASVSTGSNTNVRRSSSLHAHKAWTSHMKMPRLFSRQEPAPSTPSSLPLPPAPAPAVLAGAFWTNGSSSSEVAVLGGNFTFASSQGVVIYNSNDETLAALEGAKINGVVRSLLVHNDKLYIGGQFTLEGTNVNGFAIYNLATKQWENGDIQALQPASGSTVLVRSISRSNADADSIVVAGNFAQAGGLRCPSICKLNINSKQWNTLGEGIQGEVSSVAFAGNNQEILIAAGAITLPNNAQANVAQYSLANNTWTAVGDGAQLPGGVTALEVNNGNSSSIFAAGRSSDGSAPFLYFWNGASWTNKGDTLEGNTTISQLAMVPLQNTHDGNGVIEKDRVLMISGSLADSSFGSASSALYDGQSFLPYIVATAQDGTLGSIASLFHSFSTFSFNQRHFLATGIVILISIAIAAGVVFLLLLIGIIWTLLSRRDEKVGPAGDMDDDDDSTHHRPSSLLEHINAATRSTILGTSVSPYSNYNVDKEEEKVQDHSYPSQDQDPFAADNFQRAETPSDAFGHMLADEGSRVVHARYSFDGSGEGELPLSAGTEVEILDDKDHAWWYARDPRTGREGVIPAAYVY